MLTVLRALSTSVSLASFSGLALMGSLALQQASAQAQPATPTLPTNPIDSRPTNSGSGGIAPTAAYLPGYTTTVSFGGNTATNIQSSFGFFFDTNANLQLDGLGFSSQAAWGNGTTYTVKLWSYVNGGALPSDYTEIASSTFTHGTPYTFQDNYFWQSLGPISLPDTFTTDPTDQLGYVIAAIGDFSANSGNVQFETGTPTFNPNILNAGNGFNDASDPNGYFEVPIYDGGVGSTGYFNPNLSLVPGPLPVLGAAAGFGWTRRLRKRIRASK
ncbi:MAG: hypothetical protein VKN83_02210 [Cyanobacteriota bacterium]|nr:hypothetical protein [Cyanobacteriota bacterium]